MRPSFAVGLPLAWLGLGAQGCFSLLADAQGGFTSSTTFDSNRRGVAVNASAGGNLGEDETAEHVGPGIALRTKFSQDVTQFAFSPHAYVLAGSVVSPYARAGVNLAQVESVDGAFAYGMGSPYGELGIYVWPVVISGFAEYDVRFTSQRNEGFVGIQAGIGTGVSSESPRDGYHERFK